MVIFVQGEREAMEIYQVHREHFWEKKKKKKKSINLAKTKNLVNFYSCWCAHVLMECGTMQSFKRYSSKMSLKTALGINSWTAGGWSWHRKLKYGPDVFVMSARKNKEGCVSALLSACHLGNRLWFHFPLMDYFIHSVMIEWVSVLCSNTTSVRLSKCGRVDHKEGNGVGLNQ